MFIDTSDILESDVTAAANTMANTLDTSNDATGDVVTKLYYLVPKLDKFIIATTDADAIILGEPSSILVNTTISSYPLIKIPSSMIKYKEVIVGRSSAATTADIIAVAQDLADKVAEEVLPYKLPVIQVITKQDSTFVFPSVFSTYGFVSQDVSIVTEENPTGSAVIKPVTAVTKIDWGASSAIVNFDVVDTFFGSTVPSSSYVNPKGNVELSGALVTSVTITDHDFSSFGSSKVSVVEELTTSTNNIVAPIDFIIVDIQ